MYIEHSLITKYLKFFHRYTQQGNRTNLCNFLVQVYLALGVQKCQDILIFVSLFPHPFRFVSVEQSVENPIF